MQKIKLLTDTTSDIPAELAQELGIELKSIPLAVNGKSYLEGKDFTNQEFYELLMRSTEIPATSRINAIDFLESYCRAASEGVTDLIHVTICAAGSGTYESALTAQEMFRSKEPQLAAGMRIHLLDSRSYSFGYGHAVLEGARLARGGAQADEVISSITGWLDSTEIFLACYSLDFAKKSGRIHSTAAFVGELLGLRPIIHMVDGGNHILEKVRGDKNVVPAVCRLTKAALAEGGTYYIMKGMLDEPAGELQALLTEQIGYPPAGVYNLGASVSINSGPKVIATVIQGKRRPQK
ncbi:MAG: DegV family protein [Provencibacterium sp.]|nr:DegV family protein [Provencibacterium sp.]